jgi:hypothetical protein
MCFLSSHNSKLQFLLERIRAKRLTQNELFELAQMKGATTQDELSEIIEKDFKEYVKREMGVRPEGGCFVFVLTEKGKSFLRMFGYCWRELWIIIAGLSVIIGILAGLKSLFGK